MTETTIVILGAGASHGCVTSRRPDQPIKIFRPSGDESAPFQEVRPPLTKGLVESTPFVNRFVSRYPQSENVVAALRAALRRSDNTLSLERELERYEARSVHNDNVERHLLAFRFLLRDMLLDVTDYMRSPSIGGGPTLYTDLVSDLYEWAVRPSTDRHVCFVSFNYDVLLEHACHTTWGFDMRNLSSYCSHPTASVVKPHGSALWERRVTNVGRYRTPVEAARGILAHEGPLAIGARVFPFGLEEYSSVPELALPVTNKSELLWLPDQESHFSGLDPAATVITIGWRAAEEHFVPVLRSKMAPGASVIACNGPGAEAEAARVVRALGGQEPERGLSFGAFVDSVLPEFVGH